MSGGRPKGAKCRISCRNGKQVETCYDKEGKKLPDRIVGVCD